MKFCVSIRFLLSAFHGKCDGDEAEWPPSPLRVFQSLVAVAGARGRGEFPHPSRSALLWLEKQPAPILIAPRGYTSSGYSLSVPNNSMDIVARAWVRGNYSNMGDANPATHRTMKLVRPTFPADDQAVHYVWPLQKPIAEEVKSHLETLREIARGLFALGWGIDVAVANAQVLNDYEADALSGEKWIPSSGIENGLRVPAEGTLDQLARRHAQFVARLASPDREGLSAPMPVSAYRIVQYRSASSGQKRPIAAFSLLKPDATGFQAFDSVQRTLSVVEMVRGAAERSAARAGWSESKISTVIMGHGELCGSSRHSPVESGRFAWLPLPSLETRGIGNRRVVGSIRRIIVSSFDDKFADEIAWARTALTGEEMIAGASGTAEALLSLLPESDRMVREYLQPATTWATVTPVVLPGYDDPSRYRRRLKNVVVGAGERKRLLDRIAQRIDRLLRKAIVHCGLSQELAQHAELEWRGTGFWPGTELASRYAGPEHLRPFPRLHVRISWRDSANRGVPISGPICIGGGRFYGLGLFAAIRE